LSNNSSRNHLLVIPRWRYAAVLLLLVLLPAIVIKHIASLQVITGSDHDFRFLQGQGDARTVRTEAIPAYRGLLTDRRGEPLAVSTPVVSLWANPQMLGQASSELGALAAGLGTGVRQLRERLERYGAKEFMYLARHLTPAEAGEILRLGIPGVFSQQEYKRFYPAGEVAAQLVGFTDIDDRGQEGIELAYDGWLAGASGAKRVVKDLKGRTIKDVGLIRSEKPGRDLALSIDLRLQYLAYRELKAAINRYQAAAGSLVMLDARTGEVLAMVNQPSFNPNDRGGADTAAMRNRALTDLLEPGSTMKPLTVVAALQSGKFRPETVIDTSPGYIWMDGKTFKDHSNYGKLDLTGILTKSSQVGITKMVMELAPYQVRDVFERAGLGQSLGTGFPGESPGNLPERRRWRPVERVTFAFGYGLSVTSLQLAEAYSVLANDGIRKPVSLLRVEEPPAGEQVLDAATVRRVRKMLVSVTEPGGTGTKAAIPGYTVAGKTGTVHKVGKNGYEEKRYRGIFAGMVPAENPRLITVVVIDDPRGQDYYGGLVAAPVFSKVSADALRLLRISPDSLPDKQVAEARQSKRRGDST